MKRRIARNDPALAHAMARAELQRIDVTHTRAVQEVIARHPHNMKKTFTALRKAYGDLVLDEDIERPTGSRANGSLLVLKSTSEDPERMVLARFMFDAKHGGLQRSMIRYAVEVNLHALARTMQRSVGTADVGAVVRLINMHLRAALALIQKGFSEVEPLTVGCEVKIVSAEGALCFTVEPANEKPLPFVLLGRTWIAAATAVEPGLVRSIAECVAAGEFQLLIDRP